MTEGFITTLLVNAAVFSVLFGILLLARRLLRLSAVWQYALWLMVLIKLVIPFGWESALSPAGWFAQAPAPALEETVIDPAADTMPVIDPVMAPDNGGAAAAPDTGTPDIPFVNGETAAPPAAKSLTWMEWALIVWGAGAAVTAAWLLLGLYQVRSRMLRKGAEVPESVSRAFAACKRELGIRRRVGVRMQGVVPVPAITGVFRPVLILPAGIETDDEETLRHIILHELTHYKNGDLVMIQVMNVLNVLYWFNPLVWLCFSLMRKDMETICDQRVLGMTARERQSGYVAMLLQFASVTTGRRLYAAMSVNDGRMDMEKRIRNMCRRPRMGKGMKAAALLIAVLMLAGGVLTACRPLQVEAPKEERNNIPAAESPEEEKVVAPYTAPAVYTDEVHDAGRNIDIYIDAEVAVGAEHWNTYQLTPIEVDQAHLDTMLHALIGDAVLYREESFRSRDDIEGDIAEAEAIVAQLDENTQGDIKDFYEAQINFARQMLESDDMRIPVDTRLDAVNPWPLQEINATIKTMIYAGEPMTENVLEPGSEIEGLADLGGSTPAQMVFHEASGMLHFLNLDTQDENAGVFSTQPIPEGGLVGTDLTLEEAMAMARETVADLGYGYLDIARMAVVDMRDNERMEGDQMHQCYQFFFTRHIEGTPVTYAYGSGNGSGTMTREEVVEAIEEKTRKQTLPTWGQKEISVVVDDRGVLEAYVNTKLSAINPLAEGVALLDFDPIMEVFKEQAPAEGDLTSYSADDWAAADTVHINRIELGYMPVIQGDTYVLTPVWDFFGDDLVTFDTDKIGHGDLAAALDENHQMNFDLGRQSILTINAIDGSIIDRNMGF